MLRLLFISKDEKERLTVITDGIDGQSNVFVTQNATGSVDYFESIGISIRAGQTYNIGEFKKWAMENAFYLKGYPEGLDSEEIDFADVKEEYKYTFTVAEKTLSFPKEGGSKKVTVTSYKQLYINGNPTGNQVQVPTNFATQSPFSVNKDTATVTVAANTDTNVRTGTLTVTQDESNKEVSVSLTQEAAAAAPVEA